MPHETELHRPWGLLALSLLAIVVGVVTGLGAVFFRDLIGLIHNLLYYGHLSSAYNANLYEPPSPWGAGIILVPVLGGLGVVFLVLKFAPEARGHGPWSAAHVRGSPARAACEDIRRRLPQAGLSRLAPRRRPSAVF